MLFPKPKNPKNVVQIPRNPKTKTPNNAVPQSQETPKQLFPNPGNPTKSYSQSLETLKELFPKPSCVPLERFGSSTRCRLPPFCTC